MSAADGSPRRRPTTSWSRCSRPPAPTAASSCVEERSEAELRFANNTVTTNGTRRDRSVTRDRASAKARAAPRSGSPAAAAPATPSTCSAEPRRTPPTAPPAEDAAPLVTPSESDAAQRLRRPAGHDEPGRARGRARRARRRLRPGRAPQERSWPASPSTRCRPSISARRPGCGSGTSSRPASSRSSPGPTAASASAWAGTGAADLGTVHVEELEERLVRRLALGRAQGRAGRRPLRGRASRPTPSPTSWCWSGASTSGREAEEGRSVFSAPGGATRVGESLSPHPVHAAERSVRAGSRVHALSRHGRLGPGRVGLRQRSPARADRLDLRGPPRAAAVPPRGCGAIGRAAGRLPIDNLILELPGCDEQRRGPRRADRAGTAAHLPVVHPRGGPGDAAADRPHQRRRLPRRARRDRRCRQQLPFQREPGRRAVEDDRGGTDRAGTLAGVERVAEPHGDAGASGRRLQHELGEPGDLRLLGPGPSSAASSVSSPAQPACTRSRHDSNTPSPPK